MKVDKLVEEHYPDYLNDESGLVKGQAEAIYFPETEEEMVEILSEAFSKKIPVTVSGGGTGISGGRVPLEGWIVATDQMRSLRLAGDMWTDREFNESYQLRLIEFEDDAILIAPVSIRLKSIQNFAKEKGWFYPPDPTERSAFIGGNVATNASGARSFKYGPTRNWVVGLRVVLADGRRLSLVRKKFKQQVPLQFYEETDVDVHMLGSEIVIGDSKIQLPRYELPKVTKNVAGIVWSDNSEPIDLFIGSNGIFGVVTQVALHLVRPPSHILSIFAFCPNWEIALNLVQKAQIQREKGLFPVPMSVELLDERAVNIMHQADSSIPPDTIAIILEQDAADADLEDAITFWGETFEELGISSSSVGQTYKEIEHHKFLRHLVPETINRMVRSNSQPKLGTDYSVPPDKFGQLLSKARMMGEMFETNQKDGSGIGYAIWAHAGDSHLHLNFLPKTSDEVNLAKNLMVELMKEVVKLGGSIAAEHGLGKKSFEGKPALYFQYGNDGVEQVRSMKKAIDPYFILNRGNLVPYSL